MFQSLLKSKHQSEIPPCPFYPFIKTEHARENILSPLFQNLLWFRLRNHEEYTQKRRGEIGKGHFAPIQHANEKHSLQKFVYFKKSTRKTQILSELSSEPASSHFNWLVVHHPKIDKSKASIHLQKLKASSTRSTTSRRMQPTQRWVNN